MEDLQEQLKIETYLREVLYDPVGNYAFEKTFTVENPVIFEETLLGAFADSFSFSETAKIVLKSELQYSTSPSGVEHSASLMEKDLYNNLAKLWADLFQDPKNLFAVFIEKSNQEDYPEVNLQELKNYMSKSGKAFDPTHYKPLFS